MRNQCFFICLNIYIKKFEANLVYFFIIKTDDLMESTKKVKRKKEIYKFFMTRCLLLFLCIYNMYRRRKKKGRPVGGGVEKESYIFLSGVFLWSIERLCPYKLL